jgi:hypothetical protein
MGFLSIVISVLLFVGNAILDWLEIFIYPILNPTLLWIVIPIWLVWFFAEFFQEKKGTSLGNAITNGIVPVYVSIDWIRFLANDIIENSLKFSLDLFFKFFICLIAIIYGAIIILYGIRGKDFIHYFGRVREITYFLLMFTPIIYGVINLSLRYFLLIIIFFPVFYYLVEWIDKLTPDPLAMIKDRGEDKDDKDNSFNQQNSFNNDPYNQYL